MVAKRASPFWVAEIKGWCWNIRCIGMVTYLSVTAYSGQVSRNGSGNEEPAVVRFCSLDTCQILIVDCEKKRMGRAGKTAHMHSGDRATGSPALGRPTQNPGQVPRAERRQPRMRRHVGCDAAHERGGPHPQRGERPQQVGQALGREGRHCPRRRGPPRPRQGRAGPGPAAQRRGHGAQGGEANKQA